MKLMNEGSIYFAIVEITNQKHLRGFNLLCM